MLQTLAATGSKVTQTGRCKSPSFIKQTHRTPFESALGGLSEARRVTQYPNLNSACTHAHDFWPWCVS